MSDSAIPSYQVTIDTDALSMLRTMVGDEFPSLLKRFIVETDMHIRGMEYAYKKQQWPRLFELAHTLKGSSSALAAQNLACHCSSLEEEALTGDNTRFIESLLEDIRTEFKQVSFILSEFESVKEN